MLYQTINKNIYHIHTDPVVIEPEPEAEPEPEPVIEKQPQPELRREPEPVRQEIEGQ